PRQGPRLLLVARTDARVRRDDPHHRDPRDPDLRHLLLHRQALGQLGGLRQRGCSAQRSCQERRSKGMEDRIGEAFTSEITRKDFLKRAAVAGVGLSAISGVRAARSWGAALQTVRWIWPRGTLDVMDDFDLWVPVKMGYFKKLGINAKLIAGPLGDALATTKFVAQGQADMGYPSPGVLTASIDSGIAVKSVWDMISGQVFDFALPTNSTITSVKDLAGKKIALGSAGWSTIVDPILVEAGVDPKSVTYVNAGNQWA